MEKLQLLKSVVVFAGISDDLLRPLADCMTEKRVPAGALIFREGQHADAFFIIDEGRVAVTKAIGGDHEKVLSILGPGSIFGEMAFFADSPRTASAVTRAATVLWQIARQDFVGFITRRPATGLSVLSALMQVTMQRLDETSRELATVYQTGKIISSGRPLADVVGAVRDELLLALPPADNGAIFLYNEFNREFDPAAAPAGAGSIGEDNPLVSLLKEEGAGTITEQPDEMRLQQTGMLRDARTALLVPLRQDNALQGFMTFWSTRSDQAFGSSHLQLASSVAGQLASAIENLRHQQEEHDRQRLNDAKQQDYSL